MKNLTIIILVIGLSSCATMRSMFNELSKHIDIDKPKLSFKSKQIVKQSDPTTVRIMIEVPREALSQPQTPLAMDTNFVLLQGSGLKLGRRLQLHFIDTISYFNYDVYQERIQIRQREIDNAIIVDINN